MNVYDIVTDLILAALDGAISLEYCGNVFTRPKETWNQNKNAGQSSMKTHD